MSESNAQRLSEATLCLEATHDASTARFRSTVIPMLVLFVYVALGSLQLPELIAVLLPWLGLAGVVAGGIASRWYIPKVVHAAALRAEFKSKYGVYPEQVLP